MASDTSNPALLAADTGLGNVDSWAASDDRASTSALLKLQAKQQAKQDVLALRGELSLQAFEAGHCHILHYARWIACQDYRRALEAWDKASPFFRVACQEINAIRAAIKERELAGEAAEEWRRDRPRKRAGGAP